jgi:UDP-N-acetylglucosamine 3-dehydrogenase
MGSVHAQAYERIEGATVAGVFSRNRERATTIARSCGAKAVDDAFALLDDPTIDAVDVCVPSMNHHEFVLAAFQRGKHVFCETPFALHLAEAEAMIEAAKHVGRIFMVDLLERSIAQYEHVHRVVGSGQLGSVLTITAYRLGSYLRSEEGIKRYADPTLELMTFDFDFVRWLMGQPAAVCATAVESASGVLGEVCASLQYDSSSSATVIGSGIMPEGFPFSIGFRILFEKGAFELKTVFEDAGPPKNMLHFYSDAGGAQTLAIEEHDPYEQELRYFVDSIRGEVDPYLLDAQHAMEALKLSLTTKQAIQEHRVIRLID